MKKETALLSRIAINIFPIMVMIAFIPIVKNDYLLAAIYILILLGALLIRIEKHDLIFFVAGFISLSISEYFFIQTGVEVFIRNSFLGVMPIWLPILWGYVFVVIRRSLIALEEYTRS